MADKINKLRALKEMYGNFIRRLDAEDLETLEEHFAGPYGPYGPQYNAPMRNRYGTEEHSERMNRIISEAPRFPIDRSVYRGAVDREQLMPRNNYPMTTTMDENTARSYMEGWLDPSGEFDMPVLARINVPKGSPGMMFDEQALEDVGVTMSFGDEDELILPIGERLKRLRQLVEEIEEFKFRGSGESVPYIRGEYNYKPPYKARGGLVE